MVFVAITCVTVRRSCRFYMPQAHSHQCFRTLFQLNTSTLEVGSATATATHVLIDTTFVRVATVAINDDAIVCSHIHRLMMANTSHCITNSGTTQHHSVSRFHSKKSREGNGTPRLQLSHDIQLLFTLIRVRHCSRTSPLVPFSQKPFPASYLDSLASFILISVLPCLLHHPINFGLRQLPFSPRYTVFLRLTHSSAFFEKTLNSSMMFSSLFAVVQFSVPHCPPRLAWAALTTSSVLQPCLQILSLTSCFCTLATLQCALLVSCLITRLLCGLCTSPICSFWR